MRFYYSNEGHRWANVECLYPDTGCMMLTFFTFKKSGKPSNRFARIIKARKLKRRIKFVFKEDGSADQS